MAIQNLPGELPDQHAAQQAADRIRALCEDLANPEIAAVLALSPEQQSRFNEWSQAKLAALAEKFDVDTSASQKRVSWGMRIASTLGAIAICTAVVLWFIRYWGYLPLPLQLTILIALPLLSLLAAHLVSSRERTRYFTALLALLSLVCFVLDLVVIGDLFNIVSTERALLAWGIFALLLAYRFRLRLPLAIGLLLIISYCAAAYTALFGYRWLDFAARPEHFFPLAAITFCLPQFFQHRRLTTFPAIFRLIGALVFFTAILSLADWGVPSYLPWHVDNIERFYEISGIVLSAATIWLGIKQSWNGVVNVGVVFCILFLFTRLYHWWWDWMPRYLFFAIIGALGVLFVLAFKRIRLLSAHSQPVPGASL